jgi:Chaperonin 10 Kd subunit
MSKLAAKLTPLLDRVLVEKVAAKTKTVGGILLPESASSKVRVTPSEQRVCRESPRWRLPRSLSPGLTVSPAARSHLDIVLSAAGERGQSCRLWPGTP